MIPSGVRIFNFYPGTGCVSFCLCSFLCCLRRWKIFRAKRDEITREWRKLHNAELHALYSSPNIIRNLKSTAVGRAVHSAPVTQRARVRSPVGTSLLGEVFVRGFSLPVRQMSGSFRHTRSPNIIWPSLSSSSHIIHYGRQRPEMLTCPKTLYAFLDCFIRATCLDLRFLIMLGEECNACSSALCNFLCFPVILSLLASNILLSTLFSNTLNLCSVLKVRYQVSQSYNTTGSIIVLYALTFNFLESRWDDKIFSSE